MAGYSSSTAGKFFFGRTDIGNYMRRWILRLPWLHLRLHNILRSDKGRDLHDHPFDFISIILRGSYTEITPGPDGTKVEKVWPRFSVIRRKAEDLHALKLHAGPVWTLVIAGQVRRKWGFMTKNGWIPWTKYEQLFPEQEEAAEQE